MCEIIAATQHARWTAVKLTAHDHGADLTEPVVVDQQEAGTNKDSARYLAAGAKRALWIRCRPNDIARAVEPLLQGNTIIESNSAVGVIPADFVVFIRSESSPSKLSAKRASEMAHIHVDGINDEVLDRIRALISEQRL